MSPVANIMDVDHLVGLPEYNVRTFYNALNVSHDAEILHNRAIHFLVLCGWMREARRDADN